MMRSFMKKVKFRKNERGQVLIWVLLLLILGSIILGPLLQLMNIHLTSSHVYEKTMQRFYAADSGIEDAAYKIYNDDPNLLAGGMYNYTITDVNGYPVNVTIENLWLLEGLESWPGHPTFPHAELAVVGHITTQPTTTLTNNVTNSTTTIPVVSTAGFPANGTICIDNELITYTGKTNTQFTGCTRGAGGTNAAPHSGGAKVYGQGTLRIDITYDGSVGRLKIERIGLWLPAGFSYVNGSSAGIPKHIYIPDDPAQSNHRGGTALVWDSTNPPQTFFDELPTLAPEGSGNWTPGEEFPMKRSMSIQFTPSPMGQPTGSFAWIRTMSMDLYLSWDATSANYKVTSTAQEPDSGPQTTLESYITKSTPREISPNIYGDYRAIGNSLMIDANGDRYWIRETLLSQSNATVANIPANATVVFAYLYWSAWRDKNAADTEVIFTAQDADGVVLFNGTVTANRGSVLRNECGWSYACFADVTSLLKTESSGTVTVSATGPKSDKVTITRIPDKPGVEATVKIIAASANPGNLTVDGQTIEPGGNVTLELDNSKPSYNLTLSDVDKKPCTATITCTEGRVIVAGDVAPFILRADAFSGNGNYTVSGVAATPGNEKNWLCGQWAYAGWSLIIIYSCPTESPHQLFIYDTFYYADLGSRQTFEMTGFLAPEDTTGSHLTCFVGEGDEGYKGDTIKLNNVTLSNDLSPADNVWNSRSGGLMQTTQPYVGIDIDTFNVSAIIHAGDTSANLTLETPNEIFDLVYIIVSFRTIREEIELTPVRIITYTFQ